MIAENPRVAQKPQGLVLVSSDDGANSFDSMESSPERGVQVLKHLHPIESTSPIESFAIRYSLFAICNTL
jgi:hypothetical protein